MGGSLAGTFGATLGNIAGSFAGRALDNKLFGKSHLSSSNGARLKDLSIITSTYGNMIPIVYGAARIAGNIIWAQPIKESPHVHTQSMGGKGGKVTHSRTEYSYSVSLAISICEGEISQVLRIWANNKLLDMSKYNIRIYKGEESQAPDSLIQSIEGAGKTPAYRGQAYVVFEDLKLAEFGNHIPNFNFEVKRKVSSDDEENVEDLIESIVIIPGGGEYVYDPVIHYHTYGNEVAGKWSQAGPKVPVNQHSNVNKANSCVALDQLQETLPNVKWTAPVVTWFANSLDAGECDILPGVEFQSQVNITPEEWGVAGYNRNSAKLITQVSGKPLYGGSINDSSILRWLDEIKSRSMNTMFYPMFFVDKLDKPWRGRLSGSPKQVREFFTKENGYNNFILHYANLVKGKVEAFVIGSELIGLTKVKDENNKFPAVEELIKLAGKVKRILGPDVKIVYAADWSEYHHADGGWYNMDDLWACDDIDVIGIDAYFPLTNSHNSVYNPKEIMQGWKSGEGYEYYYEDGKKSSKKPLDEPYAWKNLEWFWSNEHYNPDGKKTKWVPKSKKIWFTEYGFPSVDCCTNQPNVFYDPSEKGSESAFPVHSKGQIDNKAQRTAIYATEKFWQNSEMVERKFLWTWDARPYPYWPDLMSVWCDGQAWSYGHWVQGKLGVSSLGSVVSDICRRAKLKYNEFSTNKLTDTLDGFVIDHQSGVRKAIETLQNAFFFDAVESDFKLDFIPRGNTDAIIIDEDCFLLEDEKKSSDIIKICRTQEVELPRKVDINFLNLSKNYQVGNQHASRHATSSEQIISLSLPVTMNENVAAKVAEISLYNMWMERNKYSFSLPVEYSYLSPTDIVKISFDGKQHLVRLTSLQLGKNFMLKCQGVADDPSIYHSYTYCSSYAEGELIDPLSQTHIEIMDLPLLPHESVSAGGRFLVAASGLGRNWSGCELFGSESATQGFQSFDRVISPATMGSAITKLEDVSPHLLDRASKLVVNLVHGELYSVSEGLFNAGHNLALVGNELIHFKNAELIAPFKYEITVLARGRQGTESYIDTHAEGERFILLNDAVKSIEIPNQYIGAKKYIKPVSIGGSLGDADVVEFTYGGQIYKTYSVVYFKRDGFEIYWIRRSRANMFFMDNLDVPIAEESEKYLVELLDEQGSTIHSKVVSEPHFSAPIDFADFRISQLSANVGSSY
jgi:hypothetical protein